MIWKNTKTLDKYINKYEYTNNKNLATIALIGSKTINISEFPNLKGIFRTGISKDNLPIKEAKKRNIKIAIPSVKVAKYIYEETANFTCYLIMKMMYLKLGDITKWIKTERTFLGNKKLLIIGMGNVGSLVYKKMKNLMNVDYYDFKYNNNNELKTKIKTADVITIHIPYNKENDKWFDIKKLSWMKNSACLINTSRGKLVDENAVLCEINRLLFAFDVFWEEPYKGKLTKYDNFIMSPHTASTCKEFLDGCYKEFICFIKKEDKLYV